MHKYLLRRLFTSLLVLIGVSVFTFLMLHLVPGDPVHALAGKMISSPEKLEEMRHEMGLDKPLPIQYFDYMRKVLHGDFGTSLKNKRPVTGRRTPVHAPPQVHSTNVLHNSRGGGF